MIDIFRGTPIWVWIILGYVLFVGIKSLKSSKVPVWRLSIMPLFFITWSLYSIMNKCAHCIWLIGVWFIALTMGFIVAYAWTTKRKIEIDRAHKLIKLPGTWIPLVLLLVFFSCKYVLGVLYTLNPVLKQDNAIITVDLLLSGFISGFSLGRFTTLLKMYLRAI